MFALQFTCSHNSTSWSDATHDSRPSSTSTRISPNKPRERSELHSHPHEFEHVVSGRHNVSFFLFGPSAAESRDGLFCCLQVIEFQGRKFHFLSFFCHQMLFFFLLGSLNLILNTINNSSLLPKKNPGNFTWDPGGENSSKSASTLESLVLAGCA